MTTPINLNKVRKDRARQTRKRQADENAAAFGQSKAEKALAKARSEQIARALDGNKRET